MTKEKFGKRINDINQLGSKINKEMFIGELNPKLFAISIIQIQLLTDKEWQKIEMDNKRKAEEQYKKEKEKQKIKEDKHWKEMDMKEYKRLKKKLGM